MSALCEILDKLFMKYNEELAWEFWLHKPTDMSWADFKLSVMPIDIKTENIIKSSEDVEKSLLKGVINYGFI